MNLNTENAEVARRLVDALLKVHYRSYSIHDDIAKSPVAMPILDAPAELQVAVVRDVVDRIGNMRELLGDPVGHDTRYMNLHHHDKFPLAGMQVVCKLLNRKLPFTPADV